MTDTSRLFVTLVYIPSGRSIPEEKTVWTEGYHDLDGLVQAAVDDSWNAGDEPLYVVSAAGRTMWHQNRRYYSGGLS